MRRPNQHKRGSKEAAQGGADAAGGSTRPCRNVGSIWASLIMLGMASACDSVPANALAAIALQQSAEWFREYMARPHPACGTFMEPGPDNCPVDDDPASGDDEPDPAGEGGTGEHSLNRTFYTRARTFYYSVTGAAWRRVSLSRAMFVAKLLDAMTSTKNRVAVVSGHAACNWLFCDGGWIFLRAAMGCPDCAVLWAWREAVCAGSGWSKAAHDEIYGTLRANRTLMMTAQECLAYHFSAICDYAAGKIARARGANNLTCAQLTNPFLPPTNTTTPSPPCSDLAGSSPQVPARTPRQEPGCALPHRVRAATPQDRCSARGNDPSRYG